MSVDESMFGKGVNLDLTPEEESKIIKELASEYDSSAASATEPDEYGFGYLPTEDDNGNLVANPDDTDFDPEDTTGLEEDDPSDYMVDYFAVDAPVATAMSKSADSVDGEVQVVTSDDDKRLVFGWAYMLSKGNGEVIIDRQGDFVDDEWEMESSAYQYVIDCRVGGEEHIRKGVATVVESMVYTQEKIDALGLIRKDVDGNIVPMQVGWWLGMYITDDATWALAKSGKFSGFSIHGRGIRTPVNDEQSTITLRKYDFAKINKALEKGPRP